jgi:hypothetical protein
MQAACEVELLNAEEFLEVLLETHPQVFAILVTPSVTTQSDENSITIAQVVSKKIYAQSQTPLLVKGVPLKYNEYADVFSSKTDSPPWLPPHRRYDFKIQLGEDSDLPPPSKIYSLSPAESSALELYMEKALARGWISPSESPLGAPCIYVPKPNGGLHLCVDYRRLNDITKKNAYPLPLISDLIDRIAKACIYSRLDLKDLQTRILTIRHDSPVGGHYGIAKTSSSCPVTSFCWACTVRSVLTYACATLACAQKPLVTDHMDTSNPYPCHPNAGTMSRSISSPASCYPPALI